MAEEVLTPQQKAAVVIISLGADGAAEVYKHLQDDEIEQLTFEIARLKNLSADELENVLLSFYQICLTQKVVTEGGVGYAREVLEKAFGEQAASSLLDKVTKTLKTKAFEFLRKADYKNVLTVIQNEHPQTIAMILSYAKPEQSSSIIAELSKEKRIDVVSRIAKMERTSPEAVKMIENIMEKKLSSFVTSDMLEIGGINYIADVMNNIDRANEKFIFDELSKTDAKLTEEIRKKMFVFEDITLLDNSAIQRFLRDVDNKDLVFAIKSTNKEVEDAIFANMSKRAAETVRSDLEFTNNVRLKDVEEAQQKIVAIIRRLEEEGELVISKGGKDEIIV